MSHHAIFQISASGMALEKTRLEVTAANIANMHSAAPSTAQVFRPMKVVAQPVPLGFTQHLSGIQALGGGVRVASVDPSTTPPRQVYEPGHPYADGRGMVTYPAVDHSGEMMQLLTALRAYEANVVAMNAAKTMVARTLDIGAQS